jgi:hypothetical protein
MPNHYHLLVETPRANLSRAIGWLQTTYSIRFNHRYHRSGHLFQGRFKAHLVEADSYSMELLRYVHLNPVRPQDKTLVVPAERWEMFSEYPWSSHRAYAGRALAPSWLCTEWLSFFASRRKEAQRRYQRFLEESFGTVVENPWAKLRLGLVLGSEEMLERARDLLQVKPRQEEVRWMARLEKGKVRVALAQALAEEQSERAWQVWVRVRLGAERRIDVARAYGYKDGSAITQILKRLEARSDPEMAARMSDLRESLSISVSSVKS